MALRYGDLYVSIGSDKIIVELKDILLLFEFASLCKRLFIQKLLFAFANQVY